MWEEKYIYCSVSTSFTQALASVFISTTLETQREDTERYIAAWIANLSVIVNTLTAVGALRALTDFNLCNARRFNSSMGNPLAMTGLMQELLTLEYFCTFGMA